MGYLRHETVYPRVYGETANSWLELVEEEFQGLSPRVRGNHASGIAMSLRPASGLSPRVRGNRHDCRANR